MGEEIDKSLHFKVTFGVKNPKYAVKNVDKTCYHISLCDNVPSILMPLMLKSTYKQISLNIL